MQFSFNMLDKFNTRRSLITPCGDNNKGMHNTKAEKTEIMWANPKGIDWIPVFVALP